MDVILGLSYIICKFFLVIDWGVGWGEVSEEGILIFLCFCL